MIYSFAMQFDFPVYKRLAHNDTAAAAGHQGGIVIPRDLENYFPDLTGKITASSPTLDIPIEAILIVNGIVAGHVKTRYQVQTWGGTRSPERRLTANLSAIRKQATRDDFLVFERSLENLNLFRISLITKKSAQYAKLAKQAGKRRWGLVTRELKPVQNREIREALLKEKEAELAPFELFSTARKTNETRNRRIARSSAFRIRILEVYKNRCAFSGKSLISPNGTIGLDAAHIVPVSHNGTDDVRNGLCLSKEIHWAFDNGLIGVSKENRIIVPHSVQKIDLNFALAKLDKRPLFQPDDKRFAANPQALGWHRENLLLPS